MRKKRALICGVTGQDGAYLSKFLIDKGYEIYGGSRDAENSSFGNLHKLGLYHKIKPVSISLIDFRSVVQTIDLVRPDEIYNLAGQSSVALSFQQPVIALESIIVGVLNLLEAIRFSKLPVKLYNAGSSECFGNADEAVTETTAFAPRSPYGVAKSGAFWVLANYREAYNIFASTGILFNHESPLRKERFVTKKIISTACRIAKGSKEKLKLGNINICRDWGWAPEYVEAMWLMLQQEKPQDFIIATGETVSLQHFVEITFSSLNLNWENHVEIDPALLRPTDISKGFANPGKAGHLLDWSAKIKGDNLIKRLVECEMNNQYF